MYCYADETKGYSIDCPRSCPMDCMDSSTDAVCSSELGTYNGACDMSQKVCEFYAREYIDAEDMGNATDILENITVAANGACNRK